jgi:transposase
VPADRIILEATGGYERDVTAALAAAGLPVVVINPRQARDFAKATGQLAKTRLHAKAARRPQCHAPPPDPLAGEPHTCLTFKTTALESVSASEHHSAAIAPAGELRR